jgi:TRAP-type mannitol/chloroaromatic compound transport system permease small subunit
MHWVERLANAIDALNDAVGRAVSWLTLALVAVAFFVVVLRYGFSFGRIWLQESYVWLHGIIFMLGAPFTLLHNGHVRIDIFYAARGPRFRATVDLVGSILFLMPTIVVLTIVSVPYVRDSWSRLETSYETGGIPAVFLLKTVLVIFCVLLGMQAVALAARAIMVLAGVPERSSHARADPTRPPS